MATVEKPAMNNASSAPLLPGVVAAQVRPAVVMESRRVIASARRWAAVRDACNLVLLVSVDWLFLRWPHTHVPMLDRSQSVLVLAAVNALLISSMWWARSAPRWRARRVANTWCDAERDQLINQSMH
jgi:hypothetical protein